METEKKDFLSWYVQNNLLSKEKFEELKTDVLKEELKNVQIKYTVETKKRGPIYKHDQDNQSKLIQEYLQAVEEVKNKKKLPLEEKLKKLLTPLVSLSKIVFPPNYASHLPFINEDINLKNELDRDNLISNPKKYFIVKDTEFREFGVLRASNKNIHLSEQYLAYLSFCRFCKSKQVKFISEDKFYSEIYPKAKRNDHRSVDDTKNSMEELIEPRTNCYSLNDIYEDWLLTLTPEKMKSNDLLDRTLVTFTIKRALNRDEKAIDKLCSLFQNTAEAIAVKRAKKRYLKRNLLDIRQQAKILLRLQITGFSPLEILKGLTDDNEKGFLRIPKNVKKFYIHWLTKEVPEQLNKYSFLDFLDVPVLLNPISPIVSNISWQLTPKAIRKFNSFSFRPNKNTNLYTWLFGTKRNPMHGRFCQAIEEVLDRYYKMEGKTNKKENASTDESNGKDIGIANTQNYEESIRQQQIDYGASFEEKGKETFNSNLEEVEHINTKKPKKSDETKVVIAEEIIEKIRVELSKKKVCERDIEIVISKRKGFSYTELGKINNISRRQVINIYNKYRQFLE